MPNPSCSVAILAGGQSSRMGGTDKALLGIRGRRLIDLVYTRVRDLAAEVLISGFHDYDLNLPVVPDCKTGPKGPVGATYALWQFFKDERPGVSGFFTIPVDGPCMPRNLLVRLENSSHSAVAFAGGRLHPAFAWWRLEDLAKVFEHLDPGVSTSLHDLVRRTQAQTVNWADPDLFFNINNSGDLARYLAGLASPSRGGDRQ